MDAQNRTASALRRTRCERGKGGAGGGAIVTRGWSDGVASGSARPARFVRKLEVRCMPRSVASAMSTGRSWVARKRIVRSSPRESQPPNCVISGPRVPLTMPPSATVRARRVGRGVACEPTPWEARGARAREEQRCWCGQRPWGVESGVTCPRRPWTRTLYFDAAGIAVATLHASMTLFSEEGSQGAALD